MSGGFKMDDYVDVAQRIQDFYERFPDGRLVMGSAPTVQEIAGKPFVWYHAQAYRDPDDPLPGDGWAAEPVPGPTQFTRDSELMNAETAAWGRAIVALGFSTKKIASAQEVKARNSKPAPVEQPVAARSGGAPPAAGSRERTANPPGPAAGPVTDADLEALYELVKRKGGDVGKTMMGAELVQEQGRLDEWYAKATAHWSAQRDSVANMVPASAKTAA